MNTDAPHPQLLRGLQLKELGRYADAESAFKEALAQEPNDAFALHQLAACQWHIPGRHKDALETINQAIASEPNASEHHVLRAFILCVLDRPKEALAAAAFGARALAHGHRRLLRGGAGVAANGELAECRTRRARGAGARCR